VGEARGVAGRAIMKAKEFVDQLQRDKIVKAIGAAEKKTSGEIRVFVSRHAVEDPVKAAQAHFIKMGMETTRERNAVLIFVAPRSHKFAVVGDIGVQQRCGDAFWTQLADEMSGHFKRSEFTNGIVHGVRKAGELLAQHFTRQPGDKNELPDDVESD